MSCKNFRSEIPKQSNGFYKGQTENCACEMATCIEFIVLIGEQNQKLQAAFFCEDFPEEKKEKIKKMTGSIGEKSIELLELPQNKKFIRSGFQFPWKSFPARAISR